ncbi:hemolysin family protein [Sediminibacillus halophilus]|uniref:Mg2+ and Co2+ transporter CorB, contains DUF21, CBS pair, and CorC-HlyC domains n=1 Tax=Sediminibacillus halophilus TaxID=482461 RepID=A0A1G9R1Y8_9BACI|nr:CNNM domain-containing protein [Sediminibacillus halophilus]SDM17233.1 Mg2+ and Co2+ transporter CorB, contains DUF21, CBS pair, and CorC-HlyC domains [Sediminibacillus halophilus]
MFFAIVFFLLVSFFLSGSETALTAVNKMSVKSKAEKGDKRSRILLKMIQKPDELITAILIGNNVSNIMLPTLVTMVAIEYGFNVGLATGILTFVLIVFAEVLPKSIAAAFAEKVSYIVFPVIRLLMWITRPLTYLLNKLTRLVIRLVSSEDPDKVSISKEEFITMVDIATAEGTFASEEKQRIKGVIDFQRLDVRDALKTPRMEIDGIPAEATYEAVLTTVMNSNHTRYPVYQDSMDNIIGVFHAKQLLAWSLEQEKPLDEFMDVEPLYVFEFYSIEKVFKLMLKERKHMAIVLDEYGGTSGILSNEDIIEAMIGLEIKDESDENEEVLIEELAENRVVCNGKISLHRLNEMFRTNIPEEEDILSGFLLREFGRFPEEGDIIYFQNLQFEILRVEENRLQTIAIEKLPE